jgi:hypothetical protein
MTVPRYADDVTQAKVNILEAGHFALDERYRRGRLARPFLGRLNERGG